MGECCLNIIKDYVGLTKAQKQHLRAQKTHIRKFAKNQTPIIEKKKFINQNTGAVLGILLKPTLLGPIIESVLGGLANGRA